MQSVLFPDTAFQSGRRVWVRVSICACACALSVATFDVTTLPKLKVEDPEVYTDSVTD